MSFADQSFIDSSLTGLIVGTLISLLFYKHSAPTENKYDKSIFGIHSGILIRNILVFVVIGGFTGLLGISSLNRDVEYIVDTPQKFGLEILLFATVPAAIVFVMTILRGYKIGQHTWL